MAESQKITRVLIMDDEKTIQLLLEESLTLMGYEVVVTANGEEAIQAYDQSIQDRHLFDVVLMDLVVKEGMGGLEASAEILKHEPGARLVATSGDSLDPVMLDPNSHGFVGKVDKPFNLLELSAFLKQVCAG